MKTKVLGSCDVYCNGSLYLPSDTGRLLFTTSSTDIAKIQAGTYTGNCKVYTTMSMKSLIHMI